jgi:hypothetical protein
VLQWLGGGIGETPEKIVEMAGLAMTAAKTDSGG